VSEDNRKRPCILRVLPTVDARVRAYAARQGLAPNVAAEDLINGAAGEIAALDKQLVTLRAAHRDAREATRRADQALESSHRSNRILAGRADAAEAEVARLTRELAGERASDEAAQEALRADVAREIEAAKRAGKEVERLRAELAATRPAPCACAALPDDLAPRLAAIAARRDVAPEIMLANVIKNGISKIEASDKYQDAQKAARGARS
jgi:chromosome segregation ATPase